MLVPALIACFAPSFLAPAALAEGVTGRVTFEGKPAANALVVASNASLAQHSYGWMERHRDVELRARTDAEGRFTLPVSGDAYGLTVACFGAQGGTATAFLQGAGPNHEIALTVPPGAEKSKTCRVRVLDANGAPVPGALVIPVGLVLARGGAFNPEIVRAAQHTDPQGEAAIVYAPDAAFAKMEVVALALRVAADGYAVADIRPAPFETTSEVRLSAGCRVTGTLHGPAGPLANAWVDLAPARTGETPLLLRQRARTDASGAFVFDHVAPGAELSISAPPWENAAQLVAGPLAITTPSDGQAIDAGRLLASSGHRIAGNLVLASGAKVPKDSTVAIWNERGWLAWAVPVGDDGAFAFDHIPEGGPYMLSIGAEGLMVSTANAASQSGMYTALRGVVTRDHTDLKIELAPFSNERNSASDLQPRDKPMRGVESLR